MSSQGFTAHHFTDDQGRPAGGQTLGHGFTIAWQHGPLGRPEAGTRVPPNGAFVEDVIKAARDRLAHYQAGPFASAYNADAIAHLDAALQRLNDRTLDREARKVEGTHHA